jgi:hypothetical protein
MEYCDDGLPGLYDLIHYLRGQDWKTASRDAWVKRICIKNPSGDFAWNQPVEPVHKLPAYLIDWEGF